YPSSCCCENRNLRAAATAAPTRLPSSSIFPKRSCGFEPIPAGAKWESGEFVSMNSLLRFIREPSSRCYLETDAPLTVRRLPDASDAVREFARCAEAWRQPP